MPSLPLYNLTLPSPNVPNPTNCTFSSSQKPPSNNSNASIIIDALALVMNAVTLFVAVLHLWLKMRASRLKMCRRQGTDVGIEELGSEVKSQDEITLTEQPDCKIPRQRAGEEDGESVDEGMKPGGDNGDIPDEWTRD
ncbi:hypothetical protein BCR34DRAFT_608130 [Clohesyomyces aquaticus]|uniref:Uncharacterized protein n=1 Tax=Clohesyomyces aquaticus TaxID=1231657 RepID=A0A1Y1YAU2_9PLEO|nr:hypothetical protein BCR34DRAFT_608130 [Clohesyomyces aquaticus]